MKNNKDGFTLMELIVVIAILGILVATGLAIGSNEYNEQKQNIYDILNGIDTYNVWKNGEIILTQNTMPTLEEYIIVNINTHENICDIEVKEK